MSDIYAGQPFQASRLAYLVDENRKQRFKDDGNSDTISNATTTWTNWPSLTYSVYVPSWAVTADVSLAFNWFSLSGSLGGQVRTVFGSQIGEVWVIGENSVTGVRDGFYDPEWFDVTAVRGTNVTLRTQGQRSGAGTGQLQARRRHLLVEFYPF